MIRNSSIDTKAEVNKLPYVEILNTIREMIFGKKLFDIQASEIESRLNKFWLNMNNEDSLAEWLDDWSVIDPIYPSAEVTIKERCKRQRLSTSEKLYIYKQIVDLKTPIKEIAFDYNLSKTAIKCIVKNTEEVHLNRTSMSSRTKTMLMTSSLVQDKIRLFLDLSRNPITAKEVWTFVFKETGIRLPIHLVRRYMKESLKLTYKIGKSRPVLYDYDKSMLIKSYFSIKVVKLLPQIDVIINIDESWFSRTTVAKRSWLRRGMDETITNIKHSGSLSLVSAITSTGWSFNATVEGTVSSKILLDYLKQVLDFLTEHHKVKKEKILILMDNAPTHRANIVMEYLNSCGTFIAFVPAYCPELAPVEKYFGVHKGYVNKRETSTVTKWKSKQGIALIARWIKQIDLTTIRRMWRTFFRELQVCLDHLSNLI